MHRQQDIKETAYYMDYIVQILKNVLSVVYKYGFTALIMGVLFTFMFYYIRHDGFKPILKKWLRLFREEKWFRSVFFLIFCVSMLLFRTVLCKSTTADPLYKINGGWKIEIKDNEIKAAGLQNGILFIPIIYLSMKLMTKKLFGKTAVSIRDAILKSVSLSFGISAVIELTQMFFRIGMFQLSDFGYSIVFGLAGGLLFYAVQVYSEKRMKNDTN